MQTTRIPGCCVTRRLLYFLFRTVINIPHVAARCGLASCTPPVNFLISPPLEE